MLGPTVAGALGASGRREFLTLAPWARSTGHGAGTRPRPPPWARCPQHLLGHGLSVQIPLGSGPQCPQHTRPLRRVSQAKGSAALGAPFPAVVFRPCHGLVLPGTVIEPMPQISELVSVPVPPRLQPLRTLQPGPEPPYGFCPPGSPGTDLRG